MLSMKNQLAIQDKELDVANTLIGEMKADWATYHHETFSELFHIELHLPVVEDKLLGNREINDNVSILVQSHDDSITHLYNTVYAFCAIITLAVLAHLVM